MLKKYKQSGAVLSAQQLKEIKAGTGSNEQQFVQCWYDGDCDNYCDGFNENGYACINHRCKPVTCVVWG